MPIPPMPRVYECPHCGDSGERLSQPEDMERAQEITRSAQLHRSRVLERVAPPGDPDREYAEEALQVYLPRAIYALGTLINRIDGLDVTAERRRLITALALAAFDAGNSLWSIDRQRPKRLSVPPQFRERNIWMALERAVGEWAETGSPVACEAWPNKIPESGICLFDGRLKALAAEVRKEIPIQAVVGAVPRSNQALWTLSSLWAGWLWGREAAEPFKIGLRRRRYDWAWNTTALHSAFRNLAGLLPKDTPVLGLLGEPEASFVSSAVIAAEHAGFHLGGLALRDEQDPLQIEWNEVEGEQPASPRELEAVRRSIHEYLIERAEPVPYLHLHTAALVHLSDRHALLEPGEEVEDSLRSVNSLIETALSTDARFAHFGAGEGVETGMWGLHEYDAGTDSLADRTEMAVVSFLQKNPDRLFLEIEQELNERYRGLLTPSKGLIYSVLYSYARREGGAWRLREEDRPASRREDLQQMAALVRQVGQRLGFETLEQEGSLLWVEAGTTGRVFFLLASALLGRVVRNNDHPPEKCVIVLPGGRAALAAYKQQRDPALDEKMRPMRLLKFRLLRSLADIPVLNRQTFEEQINSDPVEQAQGQLMMF